MMRPLTRQVARFFAGGPYRFLGLLIFGACFIGFGIFYDSFVHPTSHSFKIDCVVWGTFTIYFVGACAYAYMVYRGTWPSFWDHILNSLE